jgi:hypothetical protein
VGTLPYAAESPCVTTGQDPDTAGLWYLYVAGGFDGADAHDEVTAYPITVVSDAEQTVDAPFLAGNLSSARSECGAYRVDEFLNPIVDPANDPEVVTWIYVGPGADSAGDPTDLFDAGPIDSSGNLSFQQLVDTRDTSAYGTAVSSNFIYVLGGDGNGTSNSGGLEAGWEAEIGNTPATLPDVDNFNNLGDGAPTIARALLGAVQESSFIFIIGGLVTCPDVTAPACDVGGTDEAPSFSTEFTNY